jgi:hypothetical protein
MHIVRFDDSRNNKICTNTEYINTEKPLAWVAVMFEIMHEASHVVMVVPAKDTLVARFLIYRSSRPTRIEVRIEVSKHG